MPRTTTLVAPMPALRLMALLLMLLLTSAVLVEPMAWSFVMGITLMMIDVTVMTLVMIDVTVIAWVMPVVAVPAHD